MVVEKTRNALVSETKSDARSHHESFFSAVEDESVGEMQTTYVHDTSRVLVGRGVLPSTTRAIEGDARGTLVAIHVKMCFASPRRSIVHRRSPSNGPSAWDVEPIQEQGQDRQQHLSQSIHVSGRQTAQIAPLPSLARVETTRTFGGQLQVVKGTTTDGITMLHWSRASHAREGSTALHPIALPWSVARDEK